MEVEVKTFKLCYYREVYKITRWKNGDIYKTKSIGFIHQDDINKYPSDEYVIGNISTYLREDNVCILSPYLSNG